MNILAATAPDEAKNEVYNVALGDQTTLNQLFDTIQRELKANGKEVEVRPCYREFRAGDVRHSKADISKASDKLGYNPEFRIEDGIRCAVPWYLNCLANK